MLPTLWNEPAMATRPFAAATLLMSDPTDGAHGSRAPVVAVKGPSRARGVLVVPDWV